MTILGRQPGQPKPYYGQLYSLIAEEFGDDTALLVGDHVDTVCELSAAFLQSRSGERGLRAFLRHLRSLLGTTGGCIYALQARIVDLEEQMQLQTSKYHAAAADARETVDRLHHGCMELRGIIDKERNEHAAERNQLRLEASVAENWTAQEVRAAKSEAAKVVEAHEGWQRDVAHFRGEIYALHGELQRKASGAAQLALELTEARRQIVELQSQLTIATTVQKHDVDIRAMAMHAAEQEAYETWRLKCLEPGPRTPINMRK